MTTIEFTTTELELLKAVVNDSLLNRKMRILLFNILNQGPGADHIDQIDSVCEKKLDYRD